MDAVSRDGVAKRIGTANLYPTIPIIRNDVVRPHSIGVGSFLYENPCVAITPSILTTHIRPNQVACDRVIRSARTTCYTNAIAVTAEQITLSQWPLTDASITSDHVVPTGQENPRAREVDNLQALDRIPVRVYSEPDTHSPRALLPSSTTPALLASIVRFPQWMCGSSLRG